MSEAEKRKRRVCFTGHRPEKLHASESEVIADLDASIAHAIDQGYKTFITGMARGVDIWAGELVLKQKEKHADIHLICAPPYPGFEVRWNPTWQQRYRYLLEHADLVHNVSPSYSPSCFQVRNEWMVNHSSLVIAVYNGEASGTQNTINYAKRIGIPVITLQG